VHPLHLYCIYEWLSLFSLLILFSPLANKLLPFVCSLNLGTNIKPVHWIFYNPPAPLRLPQMHLCTLSEDLLLLVLMAFVHNHHICGYWRVYINLHSEARLLIRQSSTINYWISDCVKRTSKYYLVLISDCGKHREVCPLPPVLLVPQNRHTNRRSDRQTDRETMRQTDRWTDRQAGR
jgi:hypothetical protein